MRIISAFHLSHYRRRQYAVPFTRMAATLQYWLLVCCVCLVGYIGVYYMLNNLRVGNVLLDVRRADVSLSPEQYRIDATYLQNNLPFAIGDYVWRLNLDHIRQQLLALPWVRDVTVRVVLPNTIFLSIDEHVPVAVQQDLNGQAVLLGQDGQKIAAPTTYDSNLLHVFGEGSAHIVHDNYLQELAQQWPIKKAIRVGQRRWSVELKNGIIIRLPENGINDAVQQLNALQQQYRLLERAVKVIDLRIPNRVYVELDNAVTSSYTHSE